MGRIHAPPDSGSRKHGRQASAGELGGRADPRSGDRVWPGVLAKVRATVSMNSYGLRSAPASGARGWPALGVIGGLTPTPLSLKFQKPQVELGGKGGGVSMDVRLR